MLKVPLPEKGLKNTHIQTQTILSPKTWCIWAILLAKKSSLNLFRQTWYRQIKTPFIEWSWFVESFAVKLWMCEFCVAVPDPCSCLLPTIVWNNYVWHEARGAIYTKKILH